MSQTTHIRKLPNAKRLEKLYWKNGMSTRALAVMFSTHQRAIIKLMQQYNIPRRDRIDAVIKGCRKYIKPPFSGNKNEKAYMLGLALADFRRRKHGYQIDISLGTTHPCFASLFKDLFETYAPIHEKPYYNKYTRQYGWRLDTALHPTFGFLLEHKEVPVWVMEEKETFLHFLAGYTDGEGILSISKNSKKGVSFIFAISSGDKDILLSILKGLENLGFNPTLRILRHAGEANAFYGKTLHYKNDHYMLRLKRKDEVMRLLTLLPIKHPEKIRKRELMFKLKDKIYIKDVYT
ncbi:MAG: hypothetical protein HZB67_04870, partial [Candidatus Aenigmarchaeota archaeon]|nr:hypothetical protein [Candidatus Aenigmarchaeota archaeon]